MSSNINKTPSPCAGEGWGEGVHQNDSPLRTGEVPAVREPAHNIAIRVSNLGKCYQIYDAPRDRLRQFVAPRMQRFFGQSPKQYFRELWELEG
ncbi:MAG: hypothetical protein A2169_07385 [Deltaproteobacteria bacterium RBG_13_47_9]|nr:MAG: hypothetical protein A2169_07385 [Deltaproteobacteria bacterium RBG_13_47_9]